ncbi:hypothetical protein HMPREF0591_4381 [Mycobacterium parascrofulaceum ATCC BAA-614]|uniref:Uncharacterized protein n=1 Tax=Mycobacterium parascrofulaceum ATCC BAA-614 TaxID=525368 RepID=D5PDY7_9MYCO|nr:hypothetical protein HMPREF0591_4381 [Mycobacterium parascrofulaceum ATCC BAA-614]
MPDQGEPGITENRSQSASSRGAASSRTGHRRLHRRSPSSTRCGAGIKMTEDNRSRALWLYRRARVAG